VATRVNIHQLKARLSEYLRRVKAGQIVEISERGTPIAWLVPMAQPVATRLEAARQAGLIQWSQRKLEARTPPARVRGRRTVAELVVRGRANGPKP
jgi:prevent-host-death family protein